jgi:hypothetical protein
MSEGVWVIMEEDDDAKKAIAVDDLIAQLEEHRGKIASVGAYGGYGALVVEQIKERLGE